jgi:hypothetical protein
MINLPRRGYGAHSGDGGVRFGPDLLPRREVLARMSLKPPIDIRWSPDENTYLSGEHSAKWTGGRGRGARLRYRLE